jgi:hypothetical protein
VQKQNKKNKVQAKKQNPQENESKYLTTKVLYNPTKKHPKDEL